MPDEFARPAQAPDDAFAAELRGFGPAGIAAALVILAGNVLFLPLSALLVLAWAWRSRTPWRELGFARQQRWAAIVIGGVAGGIALKLFMKAIVMPLLGADPVNHAYHYLAHNSAALPSGLYLLIVGAGFGEEVLFRGYLFERFRRMFGQGRGAQILIVVLTSLLFAAGHFANQGVPGVEQAFVTGLVFATVYLWTGRLWLSMILHTAFDLTALALIYWDLEVKVAHSVFR